MHVLNALMYVQNVLNVLCMNVFMYSGVYQI